MYRIGILDDQKLWVERIAGRIEDVLRNNKQYGYEILQFTKSESLLEKVENIDLLFLDIELSEPENGFEVAQRIKSAGYSTKICFLTSHLEVAREGYKYHAFRFLDKMNLEEIGEAISAYINDSPKLIRCKTSDKTEKTVMSSDIIYIETIGRKLCYHMLDQKLIVAGNLKDIIDEFREYGFVQVHRSYVINMKYVESYDSRQIRLIDKSITPISRE